METTANAQTVNNPIDHDLNQWLIDNIPNFTRCGSSELSSNYIDIDLLVPLDAIPSVILAPQNDPLHSLDRFEHVSNSLGLKHPDGFYSIKVKHADQLYNFLIMAPELYKVWERSAALAKMLVEGNWLPELAKSKSARILFHETIRDIALGVEVAKAEGRS